MQNHASGGTASTRTDDTGRELHGTACTRRKQTKRIRTLLAEEVSEPRGDVGIGPGTGWRSLRKICTARARSARGVPGVCKGEGGEHLPVDDADVVLDATRIQGVS